MRLSRVYASSIISALLVSACGSANFTGSGQSGSRDNPPPAQTPAGSNPNGTSPNGNNPNGTNPNGNNPSGTNGQNPGGPNSANNPGGSNPGYPGGYPGNPGTGNPGTGPQNGPNTQISTTPTSVTFGKDMVFHIGNNQFEASSCREQISSIPISGRVYFFQFDVPAENTSVSINVSVLCGVDFANNQVLLYANNALVQSVKIIPGAPSVVLPPQMLKGGVRYTIYVTSGQNTDNPKYAMGDFDDFIVGKVVVQGDKPVSPVGYGSLQ